MPKVNKIHLLSELRKLLVRPDTKVIKRRLKICGSSTWLTNINDKSDIKNILIKFDPRRDGYVRLVLHELIHIYVALNINLKMTYEVEEAFVLAWEQLLYNYVHTREKLLESWSQAIERKLVR